jgi:branched-chain amino acid transport system permease protein
MPAQTEQVDGTAPRGAPRARRLGLPRTPLYRHLVVAAVGLVLVVVVLESVNRFRVTQLTEMAYLAIAAGGLTLLTGISGQLSLGHGAFMAVGAYTTVLLLDTPDATTVTLLVAIVAAVLVAVVVGVIVGIPAARLHGPYIAGATLALAVAVPGIARAWSWLGGEQGLTVRRPDPPGWVLDAAFFVTGKEMDSDKYVAYLSWIALIVTYVLLANLIRSRAGRRWSAVRDDEVSAEIAGIHLGRSRVLAFVASTACAGLAGALMGLAQRGAAPGSFGLTLSLLLVSAIVLGGLGTLSGALIGAGLLTFLQHSVGQIGADAGLDQTTSFELAPVIYGTTLVLVMILAPAGLMGSIRNRYLRRRAAAAAA